MEIPVSRSRLAALAFGLQSRLRQPDSFCSHPRQVGARLSAPLIRRYWLSRPGKGRVERRAFIASFAAGLALYSWLPVAQSAPQSDGQAALEAFVQSVQSAEGSFTQQTRSSEGAPNPPQKGEFLFQRPGRFKWVIREPYEQVVVADGTQLVQYDPDLAQVSIRPVGEALGNAPAAILFGETSLSSSFTLQALPPRDNLLWVRAIPRTDEAGFAHMDIGLANNLPQRIEILDAFGQTTTVEFTTLVPNPRLPADAFEFDPPAGVDVVRMR